MRWRVNFTVHLPSDTGGCGDTFTKAMDVSLRPCNADDQEFAIRKARAKLDKYMRKVVSEFHFPKLVISVKSVQKQVVP